MNWMAAIVVMGLALQPLWAIPSAVTYQGTLKDQGVPANGVREMQFRLTNENGTQVYWSSGPMDVNVHNGLFSAQLQPAGVDWENVTPYLEVSVNGQQLLPREPVNATVYARIAGEVVDRSVSSAKIVPGYGLVPSGMIALFDRLCPSGWLRYAGLDDRFPLGGSAYGVTGGSDTHHHAISPDGLHDHGGRTSIPNGLYESEAGHNYGGPDPNHRHLIPPGGEHGHGGATGSSSTMPPYITMIYCQKE